MARVRRRSTESPIASDRFDTSTAQNTTQRGTHMANRTTRSQGETCSCSRNRGPQSSVKPDDVENVKPAALIPKSASNIARGCKQIRLTHLRADRNASAALDTVKLNSKLPREHPDHRKPHNAIRGFRKSNARMQPAIYGPITNGPPSKTEEDAVEESVWAGTDSDSNFSEELSSPKKSIKPYRKKSPAVASPHGRHTAGSFKEPSILDHVSTYRRPTTTGHASRPTSSSDEENDDHAILHFTPPRLHRQGTSERPATPPQQSAPALTPKGKLTSPSKSIVRIPSPHLRPSMDAFWDAETISNWNDQYSPKKEWKSPRKLKLRADELPTSPTCSPRKSPAKRTKAEIQAKKDWESRKHRIAEVFLRDLDQTVAEGRVQELAASTGGVRFVWSKTLKSTAGRANWKHETTKTRQGGGTVTATHKHHASIELAEKVIDDESRLLNVIAHEFCHLCNFMISGIKTNPHGREFKEWGRKCTAAFRDRGVEVTTKHTYEIDYKYIWKCSNEDCGVEFKRHSKSIDPKRHTCGSCRNHLIQIKPVPRKPKASSSDQAFGTTGYAAYVKAHFNGVKSSLPPGTSHKEVMEAMATRYRTDKAQAASSTSMAIGESGRLIAKVSGDVESQRPVSAESDQEVPEPEDIARALEFITLDDD